MCPQLALLNEQTQREEDCCIVQGELSSQAVATADGIIRK
jgi:hypothetical protein